MQHPSPSQPQTPPPPLLIPSHLPPPPPHVSGGATASHRKSMMRTLLPFLHTCQVYEVCTRQPAPSLPPSPSTPTLCLQVMAACRALHAIVADDAAAGEVAAASADGQSGTADDASHPRLLPHLLALSNVALSLRLHSELAHAVGGGPHL